MGDAIFWLYGQHCQMILAHLFLQKITMLFQQHNIPFAIAGGYAVALHGVVRGTFDRDLRKAGSIA
ncbi:MAG: hypothetical protein N2Z22_06075 [Turneriella sp.]|nr:hypothetical protein [Leptospiraceae bacterium]MCX7632880.1 hypothetical protein [Turneriella sp.]